MSKSPRRPSQKKTDDVLDQVADRAIVAKPADPRQAELFDQPLPAWIAPCLPTLVDKPPIGAETKETGSRCAKCLDGLCHGSGNKDSGFHRRCRAS